MGCFMLGRIFLGRYEAYRLLGEGGMGRVYLARQTDLGRHVVVKVMHDNIAADPKFRERFQRETLLMARFQHPYAVTLFDASLNDPEGPCIVMEYIRGVTLDTLLHRNTRLSPVRVGRLLGQLCEALQAAHAEGIVHRDLKPANLMVVDPDTPHEIIKVMDFGLAKLIDPESLKKVTVTGTEFAVGTPGYISPEQAKGEELDHRSDLYSVGVILYELLSGRLPFASGATLDMLLAHATEPPPLFSAVGAGDWVPASVEAVVQACLAKDPKHRPSSARDLAERYDTALAHEQVVQEQALSPRHPKSAQRAAALEAEAFDPNALVHHLEAWMPEKIAAYKLRGFVNDVGGEVLESIPGRIRVRLGGRGSAYTVGQGPFSWLGLGRKSSHIDVELRLQRAEGQQENMLHIIVLMRPTQGELLTDAPWRERCNQIFCDLRGYLMGQSGAVGGGAFS
jgi:serine/threonine protein kinase